MHAKPSQLESYISVSDNPLRSHEDHRTDQVCGAQCVVHMLSLYLFGDSRVLCIALCKRSELWVIFSCAAVVKIHATV